jgi:hypothetical protein
VLVLLYSPIAGFVDDVRTPSNVFLLDEDLALLDLLLEASQRV